jgi:5-formyltetrahydrofolate cyclo-ligase
MRELSKAALRRAARAQRAALSDQARRAGSLALREHLPAALSSLGLQAGAIVAGYRAFGDEMDPVLALAALQEQGHRLALPVVVERAAPLVFRAWQVGEVLAGDILGIAAPGERAQIVEPAVILAPLLAFDRAGHRLGYGVGYYDRTLAVIRQIRPVSAIGLAFSVQEIEAVPAEATDMALDGVVTERGARWFSATPTGSARQA